MTMNTGWICAKCGRGVAPSEKYCDHGGYAFTLYPHIPVPNVAPATGDQIPPPWPTTTCITGGPDLSDLKNWPYNAVSLC